MASYGTSLYRHLAIVGRNVPAILLLAINQRNLDKKDVTFCFIIFIILLNWNGCISLYKY